MNSTLDRPVQFLKGVGPRRSEMLAGLGIRTIEDLLHYYPRDWQDRHETPDLTLPTAAGLIVIRGRVLNASMRNAGPSLAIYKARLATAHGKVECLWFKHLSRRFDVFAALKKEVVEGADLWVVGQAESDLTGVRELRVDEHYAIADERSAIHVGRFTPQYPLTAGITQRFIRELIFAALEAHGAAVAEAIPPGLASRRRLLAAAQAIRAVHFPGSAAELTAARERLAYEELLLLELAWLLKRAQTRGEPKPHRYELTRRLLTPFREGLGFELTAAQKRVINEIFDDMRRAEPMTRLLQGDVGSGKTIVALSALLLAVESGGQGVLMAPTEILADQHRATIDRVLSGLSVITTSLTSRVAKPARAEALAGLASGAIHLAVGTHALLEEDVRFKSLRVAVIDEQHRFGVRQRSTLRRKGSLIDLLVMTATPIPRTLALALYGDLDVSTIDELPPGRSPIHTMIATEEEAFGAVRAAAAAGRQAYIVHPLIEDSAAADLRSAKAEHERLSAEVFPGLAVGLIHGAMPSKAKAKAMKDFASGATKILVATTVIEVGIDVPNATVMVVRNAERFGLASLHQLRGRIGRGAGESSCYLVGDARSPQARARLDIVAATADGFRIGEEDLKLRGPGELLGVTQSGEFSLRIADLSKDAALVALAREDAQGLLAENPALRQPSCAELRRRMVELYQKRWNWIDLA